MAATFENRATTKTMNRVSWVFLLFLLRARGLPLDFHDVCGTWMEAYTQMHAEMEDGTREPRYAIAVPCRTGFADRLVGIVTVFYYSLLTKRAFKILHENPDVAPFEAAYDSPHIDWTFNKNESFGSLARKIWSGARHPDFAVANWPVSNASDYGWPLQFRFDNLSSGDPPVKYLVVKSNRGVTSKLFNNPYHAEYLYSIGLRPETSFGCIFQYLFRPIPTVLEMYRHDMKVLTDPVILKIGIQVRCGDHVFHENATHVGSSLLPRFLPMFQCAEDIEKTKLIPGQRSKWVLISDSLDLRLAAIERFGDKIVTWTGTKPMHTSHDVSHSSDYNHSVAILQNIVGEHWVFGLTDYQIITEYSGVGRTAALRSLKSTTIYSFNAYESRNYSPGGCGDNKFKPVFNVLEDYSKA
eukprot:jgi/Botrbrau1/9958/Bobra.0012s0053.1